MQCCAIGVIGKRSTWKTRLRIKSLCSLGLIVRGVPLSFNETNSTIIWLPGLVDHFSSLHGKPPEHQQHGSYGQNIPSQMIKNPGQGLISEAPIYKNLFISSEMHGLHPLMKASSSMILVTYAA